VSATRPPLAGGRRFAAAKPKPVQLAAESLVAVGPPSDGSRLPLVAGATVPELDLAAWASDNRARIDTALLEHGGMLFRGFRVSEVEQFEAFAKTVADSLIEYSERSSPRSNVAGRVYTSTDHPPDQRILLHNEQSYTLNWPMKIAFACLVPAREGGRTPLADTRRILARLDEVVVSRFAERGVMYVRNYDQGLGLPWTEVFQTEDRAAVNEHCRAARIEFAWLGGDRLRTRQVRPALRRHPQTGELLWFNHALFFHSSSMEASLYESLRSSLGDEEMPFNVFYGDGSAIEPATLTALRAAYDAETVSFPWRAGDVLLLDNMLACHGREAFVGPRQLLTAMADPVADPDESGAEP
jgi:alpha-ketoglutarate-dependent taurine dioxygenase